MKKKFLLFDVDGVLVRPGGYRQASRDTLRFFLNQMGVEANLPGEDGLSHFEAVAITNEWDMVPLSLAIVLDELLKQDEKSSTLLNLEQCIAKIRAGGLRKIQVDYQAGIQRISTVLVPRMIPCQAVLTAVKQSEAGNLFSALSPCLLEEVLGFTRDVRRSPTTRIFQQFILGSKIFSQVYGLSADLQVESYLLTLDRPLLTPETRAALITGIQERRLYCAGLTLRPSLPPVDNRNGNAIYSPETDLARPFINVDGLPIIGYGEMNWLAERMGMEADMLIKPSPYQALTALARAAGLDLSTAFDWVGQILRDPTQPDGLFLDDASEIELHIFEDSVVGILSVQRAAQLLAAHRNISVQAHGIGRHPVKVAALQSVGATVDDDINSALVRVLQSESAG